MLRALITGVSGFVGHHLTRELAARGIETIGVGTHGSVDNSIQSILKGYVQCDLTDEHQVADLPLQEIDIVFSLAGMANVGASFSKPEKYKKVNVGVLSVLGERLVKEKSPARVVAISTGAVYAPDQAMPLNEGSGLAKEGSPYAQSKIMMESEAERLRQIGLDCVIARPFNHSGPGQAPGFLIPDLYKKLIEARESDTNLKVGDLSTRRDYTDVRDIVRAYADLATAEALEHNLYNVCSGISRSGDDILKVFLDELGLQGKIEIESDPSLLRPGDPEELYGDCSRLKEDVGWVAAIPFEQTIRDFIAWQQSLL